MAQSTNVTTARPLSTTVLILPHDDDEKSGGLSDPQLWCEPSRDPNNVLTCDKESRAADNHTREGGGIMYICGMAKNNSIPTSASSIDTAGDCCFFTPVSFPNTTTSPPPRFVSCAADMQLFAGLTVDGNLWGWGVARSALPQTPTCLIDSGDVVAYDVGASFLVAVLRCGRIVRFSKTADGGNNLLPTPEYFFIQEEDGKSRDKEEYVQGERCHHPVQISAAGDTCAVVCSDGSLWTMGPSSSLTIGHQHNKASKDATTVTTDANTFNKLPNLPPIAFVSIGSRHGAAVSLTDRSTLYVWGDGLSGNLD